jgi:U3 small nucleolar RNA-associated protein 15
MAAQVLPIPQLRLPAGPTSLTPDQRYWASFSTQRTLPAPNASPVTAIATNRASSSPPLAGATHHIAVTAGPRILLLSPTTLRIERTLSRTTSAFRSARPRADGRAVLAGSDAGALHVFDARSRAVLRTWDEHAPRALWAAAWHPADRARCLSAGDDGAVRLWDLGASESVWRAGRAHGDYARCAAFAADGGSGGGAADLVVSGGYDATVRLWDPRVRADNGRERPATPVMTFRMPAPVEAVLPLPGGTSLAAAAGAAVAVLDFVGARARHVARCHQKTVTSLALAAGGAAAGAAGSRVLAGALDGHVKVLDTASWLPVAAYKHAAPVLALAVVAGPSSAAGDRHVCVGTQAGLVAVRTRLPGAERAARRAREREMEALMAGAIDEFDAGERARKRKRGEGWDRRVRGKDHAGAPAEHAISPDARRGRKKLPDWEHALRRGEYALALDRALATDDRAQVGTLLAALAHRSALRAAVRGRDGPRDLLPLLRWLLRALPDPRTLRAAADAAMVVLDECGARVGRGEEIDGAVEALHDAVRRGAEVAQMALSTAGMLDLLNAGTGT